MKGAEGKTAADAQPKPLQPAAPKQSVATALPPKRFERSTAARVAPSAPSPAWFLVSLVPHPNASPGAAETDILERIAERLGSLQAGFEALVAPRPACPLPVRVAVDLAGAKGEAAPRPEVHPGSDPASLLLLSPVGAGAADLEPLDRVAAALLLLGAPDPPPAWRWAADGLVACAAVRRMPDAAQFLALKESWVTAGAGEAPGDPVDTILEVLNGDRASRPLAGSLFRFLALKERSALQRLAARYRQEKAGGWGPAALLGGGVLSLGRRKGPGGYWEASSRLATRRRHRVDRVAKRWAAWLEREATGAAGDAGLAWTAARMARLLAGRPRTLLAYLASLLLATLTVPLLIALFGRMLDAAYAGDRRLLYPLAPVAAGYAALGLLFAVLFTGLQSRLTSGALRDLQVRLARQVLAVPAAVLSAAGEDDIAGYVLADAEALEPALAAFCAAAAAAATAAVQLAAAVASDPLAAGPVLGLQLLVAACLRFLNGRVVRASIERQAARARLAAATREMVAGAGTIRAHGGREGALRRLEEGVDRLAAAQYRMRVSGLRFSTLVASTGQFLQGAVLAAFGFLIVEGYLTVPQLSSVYLSVAAIGTSLSAATAAIPEVSKGTGPLLRIVAFLHVPPEEDGPLGSTPGGGEPIQDEKDAKPPVVSADRLSFAAPSFGAAVVVDRATLELPAGRVTCVVGPSGSGKSALLRLLAGELPPSGGLARAGAGGSPAARVVGHPPFLFRDTVRANIAYGAPGATLDDVRRAARLAQVDEAIEALPLGYDTVVEASTLSAARRQRVALARALAARPRLLLLDEFASSLDPEAARRLLGRLAAGLRGEATLVHATHRAALAEGADLVVVMKGGRVAETGTHEQLLRGGGLYAALLRREGVDFGPLREPHEVVAALRHFAAFAAGADGPLEALARAAAVEPLQRDDALRTAGAPLTHVELVLDGCLARREGDKQSAVRRCEAPDLPAALLRLRPRAPAALAAADDARVLRLPLRAVNDYARGLPPAALQSALGIPARQRAAFLWQRGALIFRLASLFVSAAADRAREARERREAAARHAAEEAAAAEAERRREEAAWAPPPPPPPPPPPGAQADPPPEGGAPPEAMPPHEGAGGGGGGPADPERGPPPVAEQGPGEAEDGLEVIPMP